MARAAKPTRTKKPTAAARKPSRPAVTAKKSAAKVTKSSVASRSAAATRQAIAPAMRAPMLSKDALRAQVEKLERTNATLRSKSRETNKAAKIAAARIAELESRVAQLEKRAAREPTSATAGPKPKPAAPTRSKQQSRGVDPGDAAPPGAAVEQPGPLDEAATTALPDLEQPSDGE